MPRKSLLFQTVSLCVCGGGGGRGLLLNCPLRQRQHNSAPSVPAGLSVLASKPGAYFVVSKGFRNNNRAQVILDVPAVPFCNHRGSMSAGLGMGRPRT